MRKDTIIMTLGNQLKDLRLTSSGNFDHIAPQIKNSVTNLEIKFFSIYKEFLILLNESSENDNITK